MFPCRTSAHDVVETVTCEKEKGGLRKKRGGKFAGSARVVANHPSGREEDGSAGIGLEGRRLPSQLYVYVSWFL